MSHTPALDAITITQQEILEALSRARTTDSGPADARTLNELIDAFNIPRDRLLSALRQFNAEGRLSVYSVKRPSLRGVETSVPAYVIRPKAKPKKAKR